jgi:hypothetical protein
VPIADPHLDGGAVEGDASRRPLGAVLVVDHFELGADAVLVRHACRVHPVGVQGPGDRDDRGGEAETDPEVPVGEHAEPLVEPADAPSQVRVEHHPAGTPGDDVAREQDIPEVLPGQRRLVPDGPHAVVDDDGGTAGPGGAGVRPHRVGLARELVGRPQVVVVDERHPRAGGRLQAGVAGGGDAERDLVADGLEPAVRHRRHEGAGVV